MEETDCRKLNTFEIVVLEDHFKVDTCGQEGRRESKLYKNVQTSFVNGPMFTKNRYIFYEKCIQVLTKGMAVSNNYLTIIIRQAFQRYLYHVSITLKCMLN